MAFMFFFHSSTKWNGVVESRFCLCGETAGLSRENVFVSSHIGHAKPDGNAMDGMIM